MFSVLVCESCSEDVLASELQWAVIDVVLGLGLLGCVKVRVRVRHLVVIIKVKLSGLGMHYANQCPHRNRSTSVCLYM